jgi:hypothetical protein
MPASSLRDVARLAVGFLLIGLAVSRISLVAHELGGHALPALALGADVTEVRFFWFAGGWIRYDLDAPSVVERLVIGLGGIAVELVLAAAAALAARRVRRPRGTPSRWGPRLGLFLVAFALLDAVHALFYLATGGFHGHGDGLTLSRVLGDARVPFALAVGALACVAAFVGARALGRLAVPRLAPRGPRGTAVAIAGAALVAALGHAGLAAGELALRRDRVYGEIMRTSGQRATERALAAARAAAAARGAPLDPAALAARRAALEAEHRQFPFRWALAAAIALAGLGGLGRAVRAPRPTGSPPRSA